MEPIRGAEEITPSDERHSCITSHSIGVAELGSLLAAVRHSADAHVYRTAVLDENVLGLETEQGRLWRYKTLRRIYQLRPDSVLFRALRDLWPEDVGAQPLLAALCALAADTAFRASAAVITGSTPGDEVTVDLFEDAIDERFPDAYAASTLAKAASNAYASWQQSGHLGEPEGGRKIRQRAVCRASNVAYALMLGHLQGWRGEALFDTVWTQVLDQPRSHLYDQAFAAAQRGMLEYRHAGGVVEVGFKELLRPMEGELL